MALKLLSCLLLATLTISTCFMLNYLVIWLHERVTGRSVELDTIVAYILLISILTVVLASL